MLGQDILAIEQDFALGALTGIEAVNTVEDAQQGRLATAGGTDESGYAVRIDRYRDVLEGVAAVLVVEIEMSNGDLLLDACVLRV